MKRFSQTLRVLLALLVATFGTSVVPTAAVYAMDDEKPPVVKNQIETDTVDNQTESTVVDDEDATDETGTTPSEPTDITTSEDDAPRTDEKEATKDIVQTVLSPDTAQRQSSVVAAVESEKEVTFCHATPPADAKNGWNKLNTAVEVVFNNGHDSRHAKDIIPPFYYEKEGETKYFKGLNWDEAGQAIFKNDCVDETVVVEEPFLQTYHDASVCGQITISLRNASPWMYRVLIEQRVDGGAWEKADGSVSGAGIKAAVGVLAVDNRGDDVADDRTGHYTVTFAEDSGTYELRYKVSSGAEQDLYVGLPVGEFTYTESIDSDCMANPVIPAAPYVKDLCYDDRDGIFVVSNTKGVKYYVDGKKVRGWTWVPFTGEPIEVTAEAKEGYEIPEGTVASWTFDSKRFTDEQCLTITKSTKVASDTNLDGRIGLGDEVTWIVTVTNTSDKNYEKFWVTVDDPNTELEDKGYIGLLKHGESRELLATSTITAAQVEACKVTNNATFSGWRAMKLIDREPEVDASFMRTQVLDNVVEVPAPLATGSATATYNLYCPEPEQPGGQVLGTQSPTTPQVLATSTALPAVLPATGASPQETNYLLLGVVLSAAAYYVAYRRQMAY